MLLEITLGFEGLVALRATENLECMGLVGYLDMRMEVGALGKRAVTLLALVIFALVVYRGTVCLKVKTLDKRSWAAGLVALKRPSALMNGSVVPEKVLCSE